MAIPKCKILSIKKDSKYVPISDNHQGLLEHDEMQKKNAKEISIFYIKEPQSN